jgi:hypothetical protein
MEFLWRYWEKQLKATNSAAGVLIEKLKRLSPEHSQELQFEPISQFVSVNDLWI